MQTKNIGKHLLISENPNYETGGSLRCLTKIKSAIAFDYDLCQGSIIPKIYIDGNPLNIIPNNINSLDNNKITNMYVDYGSNPWKLIIEVFIDGSLYQKSISLEDL